MALGTVVCLLTLAGCTPKDHVSARLVSDRVEFVGCDAFKVNNIEVYVRPLAAPDAQLSKVWVATGKGVYLPSPKAVYGKVPSGFGSTVGPATIDPSRYMITVGLAQVDSLGSLRRSAVGIFDGSKLSETQWLNWDGNLVSNPC